MAENDQSKSESGPNRTQWDDMDKEDVIKQMKKQLLLLKKVKLKCDDLSKSNANLETELRLKNEECVNLKSHIEVLETENDSMKNFLTKLETDTLNYSTRIKTLEEQLECVSMKEETANATFKCMQEEITTLQDKNKKLFEEVDILNSARDDALSLLKSRERELKISHEKDVEDLVKKLELALKSQLEWQSLSEDMKCENERIHNTLNEVTRQSCESNNHISDLEKELEVAERRFAELNVKFDECSSRCENLTFDSGFLKTKLGGQEARLKDIQCLVETLSESCGVSNEIHDVVNQLKACATIFSSKFSWNSSQDNAIHIINNKIVELENIHVLLNGQIEKSIGNLENLESKVDSLESHTSAKQYSVSSQTDERQEGSQESCPGKFVVQDVVEVEKIDKSVQIIWDQVNQGVEVLTQTEDILKVDAFTESDVNDLLISQPNLSQISDPLIQLENKVMKDNDAQTEPLTDLPVRSQHVTQEDAGTQTESVVENVEKVTESLSLQREIDCSGKKLQDAEELVGKYKTVAVKAKREVAELRKKINDLSKELQVAINDRNSCQTRLEATSVQMATATKDRMAADNSMKSLQIQLNNEKEKHKATVMKLEQALKEANKSNLISLEIADYEKLVGELNKQLENKDSERNKLLSEFEAQKQTMKALETEIEQLELQNRQSEERAEQLKTFSTKLKGEISDLRTEEREWKAKENIITAHQETMSQEIENYKLQLSELVNENNSLRESNRVLQDVNQKVLRSSESRIAALVKELQEVKEEYSNCQSEYENYKVRVHSVLKQQKKSMASGAEEASKNEDILEEKGRLGKMAEMLQSRVQELTAQLNATNSELESLQEEHQNVLQRHNKLLQNVSEQESSWKQRFEVIQKEMQSRQQELNHTRQVEKQQQQNWSLNLKQQIETMESEHKEKMEELQSRLDLAQDEIARLQRDMIESRNSANSVVKDDEAALDVVNTERQEGEGSESTDTVFGTPYRLGAANLSHVNSAFIPLDQLLNQDEKASVYSAASMEIDKLENQLSLGMKKIDHLTEILNESEATNARMTEQTRVLKEEIRRLERNQEREQHLANLEYMKNVIVKFLSLPKGDERERLVPVLTTLLRLSPDEERQVHNVALGIMDLGNPVAVPGWSSYLPKWPGTF